MGIMIWILSLAVLSYTSSSKEKMPTGFVMLHEPDPEVTNATTDTTLMETMSTLQSSANNSYLTIMETTTNQNNSTGLPPKTEQKKSNFFQIHFSFGVEDGKLKIEIRNATKNNNNSVTVFQFPDRKDNITLLKDLSDQNPDSEHRIVKKLISPNGSEIKMCIGKLSKTNYCQTIGKCEHYPNWLGEIIGTINSTEALNLYIQMDSIIWQELVNKNNNCENLNHKRAFAQIIFTKAKKGEKTKSGKDVNIFYVDTIKGSIRRVDLFQSLCLPSEQCLKFWFPKEHQSVPLYNIQISRNPPEDYVQIRKDELVVKKISCFLPDWISVAILCVFVILFYAIIWNKSPCVRNEIVNSP